MAGARRGGGASSGQAARVPGRLVRVGADPAGLRAGSVGGGLRPGCFLLCQPGAFFHLGGVGAGLVPVSLRGAHPLTGLGPCLLDRGVALGFRRGDPRGGVLAGLLHRGVPVGFGCRPGRVGPGRAPFGGGQLRGHLLRGRVRFGAELVGLGGALLGGGPPGFGGRGPLLGGGPRGFHLGFGRGGVGPGLDGVAQLAHDAREPVGLGMPGPQQLGAGQPCVGDRLVGVGRGGGPGRGGGQAAALPPRGQLGVPAALGLAGRPGWPPGRRGSR